MSPLRMGFTKMKRLIQLMFAASLVGAVLSAQATPGLASMPHHSRKDDLNTRLTRATDAGDYAEMRRLLAHGADPNFRRTNAFRYPLLLIAASRGHAKGVEILLS